MIKPTEPDINEVKNNALKYLKEMKIDDAEIMRIIKMIETGSFLRNEGRELEERVEVTDIEFMDKKTGKIDERCEESSTPYVIVGDAEVVQINNTDVNVDEAEEISWGVPCKNEYNVKCVKVESEIEYYTFIMRRRECVADIKIIPKTPIVLIEVEEENSCWTSKHYYYLYVHPFGWWTYS